ncbi:family 16 glycosylhydrolase [Rhizobium sp. NFR03]|uniref:family 16 glycosylhydrolase n=1 Tax=Rhizobium sp. NFR03 TaxID=1566263 RepID=UPI0008C75173|nr:family 16 glycosylhydrolase [Rhizobium sp. NFR03]SES14576.1 Hemolysin-type calcium-binding repeat-containing protein [Rhizobium sp. NFR03]
MAKSIKNAAGKTLYYSNDSNAWAAATEANTLFNKTGGWFSGTAKDDSIWGKVGLNATLMGGAGDDIYYLASADNLVYEAAGKGTDTVSTYFSYQLTNPNLENLIVNADDTFAFGNSLDNIITGGKGSQTLWGALGNDVLTGGAGDDTFIITGGGGHDTITDLGATDTVRIAYYTFTNFADVLKNARQSGTDTVIKITDSASLTLSNTKVGSLTADQFDLNVSKAGMKLTFSDNFDKLSLNTGKNGGTWDTKFWYASDKGSSLGTGEQQWYVNPSYAPTSSVNPFSIKDGVLTINAAETPADLLKTIGYDYTSGVLTTHSSFAQTYGYFEIRADLPDDVGAWPAFWLLPTDGSWPPELDVFEAIGGTNSYFATAHTQETGEHTKVSTQVHTQSTEGFHTYGLLWTKDELTWTFDGTKVASTKTPDDMHSDMYLLVNQSVGGWAGTPSDKDFADGSQFNIDYIKVYSLPADGSIM